MTNPTQINQGGAANQERQDPKNTGTKSDKLNVGKPGSPKRAEGGAGEPQTKMEPEKQGGIGGP
jgi:hypothetical protein